jgi:hypothetical protein
MIVRSQEQFDFIKPLFHRASNYRLFSRYFRFAPELSVTLTGESLESVLPNSGVGSARRRIFEVVFQDNVKAEDVNRLARELSPNAEQDADLFIAAFNGYVRIT